MNIILTPNMLPCNKGGLNVLLAFLPSFLPKIIGGGGVLGPPGPSPRSATGLLAILCIVLVLQLSSGLTFLGFITLIIISVF